MYDGAARLIKWRIVDSVGMSGLSIIIEPYNKYGYKALREASVQA